MDSRNRSRLWLTLPVAAAVVAAAWASRGPIEHWTRQQVSDTYRGRIESLPDSEAAALVRQLAGLDAAAPRVLVPLMADRREAVAQAAAKTLHRLVTDWQRLPGEQAGPRAVALARELAAHAERLPPERRPAARELAARLLAWQADSRSGAAQIVADCEAVLRMPATADGLRVAAVPKLPVPMEPEPQTPEAAPPAIAAQSPATAPSAAVAPSPAVQQTVLPPEQPFYGLPREPERLIDASRERPEEPRQLRRPRAMKIEG